MMSFTGTQVKCKACVKTVYPVEQLSADGVAYHKSCFKCSHCKSTLKVCHFFHWLTISGLCSTVQLYVDVMSLSCIFGRHEYRRRNLDIAFIASNCSLFCAHGASTCASSSAV